MTKYQNGDERRDAYRAQARSRYLRRKAGLTERIAEVVLSEHEQAEIDRRVAEYRVVLTGAAKRRKAQIKD